LFILSELELHLLVTDPRLIITTPTAKLQVSARAHFCHNNTQNWGGGGEWKEERGRKQEKFSPPEIYSFIISCIWRGQMPLSDFRSDNGCCL